MSDAGAAPNWHALPAQDVLLAFDSSEAGLAQREAECRLERNGPNRLTPPKGETWVRKFLRQMQNLLIYVLLGAALVSAMLGHGTDTTVIVGVVFINALFGLLQEGKAERALASIRTLLRISSSVWREGQRQVVDAETLVTGDVVLLESGDLVPADLRLLSCHNLLVQESALTGESVSVDKQVDPVSAQTPLAERRSMLYAGTLVTQGRARGLVIATGDATEIGHIGTLLRNVAPLTTPLLRQLDGFGRRLTLGILLLCAFTFLIGWLGHSHPMGDLFMAIIGIAVAAIPEGLPAVITISLAIGVQRMARRQAIIRRLPAVETLGEVSIICTDKTGTLTRNEMTAQSVLLPGGELTVEGIGYAFKGSICQADATPMTTDQRTELQRLALVAALCNDARFDLESEPPQLHGDPTEGCLLVLAAKAGVDMETAHKTGCRLQEIPFESELGYMATVHRFGGRVHLLLKGAPEQVLARCRGVQTARGDRPLDMQAWYESVQSLAERGQRVLAVAERDFDTGQVLAIENVRDCLLLGLVGMADPPRQEATQAVRDCQTAGIRLMMITGDHASTARAIGQQLGLPNAQTILSGDQLDKLDDQALYRQVGRLGIVARATPTHKLRLIHALQHNGEVVAMTGDGVNDAPALKRADVGVAMGVKGTEAAKEAAMMVLADDNIASLRDAVQEGRNVYDNLRKTLIFLLPTNGAQALVLVVAILMGWALPITPVQILWVNMVSAISLSLPLAFEAANSTLMHRPPRPPHTPILTHRHWGLVALAALLLCVLTLEIYEWSLRQWPSAPLARSLAINALVAGEMVYLISCRQPGSSTLTLSGWFGNPKVWLAFLALGLLQLGFTYLPPLQNLFGTLPLPLIAWPVIGLAAGITYLLLELLKWLLGRVHWPDQR